MAPDPAVGTVVAGYRIVAPLGSGGMGVVYRAEEVGLGGRPVALKLLAPALAGDPAFRERFLREMRVAAAIDHPNIVPIYRAGDDHGHLYLAMRYVEAGDLRGVLDAEGRLTPARTLAVLEQVARALDAAHARGLVHRDVKPGNILLLPAAAPGEQEHVYLVDFGLARSASDDRSITGGGLFLGTPRYAAPEQAAGRPIDGRTDGYALGCVLYECLAGRPPFTAASSQAVLLAHQDAVPPRLTAERPDLPPAIDQVVLRALAKAKEDRFPSCRELVAAARRALDRPRPAWPVAGAVPPAEASVAVLDGYLPTRGAAARLRRALWVAVLIALVSAVVNLGDTAAVRLLRGQPAEGPPASHLYLWVGLVQALWFLVSAWLWLAWFWRAYANLPALGARRLRYRRWWALGAWLLPIFSLFRPKQVLNDVWRASDPDLPPEAGDRWRGRPVTRLLGWWWLAFLASVLVRSVTTESVHAAASFMLLGLLPEQLDRYQASAGAQVLADLLTVLTGLLALRVVRRVSARQERRAARLAG
jgi:serine/threonine-protein kinase